MRRGNRAQLYLASALFLSVWSWPASAGAELYTFTDKEGVLHFTNIPPKGKRRLSKVQKHTNTFEWKDDTGATQRIHRVDVKHYDALIVEAARYYSLPAALIKAVTAVESSFEPHAVSHAGAQGLMQLIPSTARDMFVRDPFNPRDNIFGGARYLRMMANRFSGDLKLTVAAYNAGPEAVARVGRIPNIPETQNYVRRVVALYQHYQANWRP